MSFCLSNIVGVGLTLICVAAGSGAIVVGSEPKQIDVAGILAPIRAGHDLPAMAAAIVTSKSVVALAAVGVRKYGSNVPVTIDDQFHLGSDTKAMTATLIGMLVDEGKLHWTTTLSQALPDLAATMNVAYRQVTLEQLLAHRAGFSSESWPAGKSFDDMYALPGTPREQRKIYVAAILREPPVTPPGSKFLYSNRSFAVAGAIAERYGNMSWEELMRKRLFEPLGMRTAGFGSMGTPGMIDEPWQHTMGAAGREPVPPGPRSDNPPVIAPAGTAHCSVGDWAKFIQMELSGEQGHHGLLEPETLRHMHTQPYGDYGFGWIGVDRGWGGGRVLTHAGSNNMNFCVAWLAPKRDFAVLIMTNQGGDGAAKACDEAASKLIMAYVATLGGA